MPGQRPVNSAIPIGPGDGLCVGTNGIPGDTRLYLAQKNQGALGGDLLNSRGPGVLGMGAGFRRGQKIGAPRFPSPVNGELFWPNLFPARIGGFGPRDWPRGNWTRMGWAGPTLGRGVPPFGLGKAVKQPG